MRRLFFNNNKNNKKREWDFEINYKLIFISDNSNNKKALFYIILIKIALLNLNLFFAAAGLSRCSYSAPRQSFEHFQMAFLHALTAALYPGPMPVRGGCQSSGVFPILKRNRPSLEIYNIIYNIIKSIKKLKIMFSIEAIIPLIKLFSLKVVITLNIKY